MSFHSVVEAEELAEFLRSNDGNRPALELKDQSYMMFDEWSNDQLDAVVEAAKSNNSVRTFSMNVEILVDDGTAHAEAISSFVRHLKGLQSVDLYDAGHIITGADPPTSPDMNDIVLRGIMKGEAKIKDLRLAVKVHSGRFLTLVERFPHLESFTMTGPCPRAFPPPGAQECVHCSSDCTDFATEVALAASRGLKSLRRVTLELYGVDSSVTNLLSDLGGAASTKLVELRVLANFTNTNDGNRLSEAIARFCVLTRTLKVLKVTGPDDSGEEIQLLDVTPMFEFWSRHEISDSIQEIHLDRCKLGRTNAIENTLRGVKVLRMKRSVFDPELSILDDLPRLTSLHVSFNDVYKGEWGIVKYPLNLDYRVAFLEDNSALEMLCETIENPGSSMNDVEIDLVGGYDGTSGVDMSRSTYERFAASERLLRAGKGRLAVNFESLPIHSCQDIVDGLSSLRADLNELRIRFVDCKFSDSQYSRILKALRLNKSLQVFEFGQYDWTALTDQRITDICDLATTNDSLHTLSLPGLGPNDAARFLEQLLPILTATANVNLRSLQLHGADLTNVWPRVKEPILSMLEKNRVLSELGGCTIPWADPSASRVRHLLKLNGHGRRFLPPHDDVNCSSDDDNDPPLPRGLWGTILGRISVDKAHDVMHTFLRAKLVTLLHDSAYDPPAPLLLPPPPSSSLRPLAATALHSPGIRRKSGRKRGRGAAEEEE